MVYSATVRSRGVRELVLLSSIAELGWAGGGELSPQCRCSFSYAAEMDRPAYLEAFAGGVEGICEVTGWM